MKTYITSSKPNNKKFDKTLLMKAVSVLLALLSWEVISYLVDLDILLASPSSVFKSLFNIVRERDFYSVVLFSFVRISGGFLLAFLSGILMAALSARFKVIEILLWPYVVTIKTVPVASFIIIAIIWLSTSKIAAFISFLMVFPIIYQNTLAGIRATDPRMTEMAKMYRIPLFKRIGFVYLPTVRSHILSASSVSLGTCWKAGVAAEVIACVNNSIGEKLYESKIYLLSADLMAWTVVIVLVSVLFEKFFIFILTGAYKAFSRCDYGR